MPLRLSLAAKILLLALTYVIAGQLALMLAIPPGFASAIFPPVGIALAAVLIWGYPLLLGVLLGSTLLNLSIGYSASGQLSLDGLWVATGIALSTSAQCFCGAWLIKRFVGFPNPLIDEKSIFSLLLIGGPLSCVLSATGGTGALFAAGIIDASALPFSWWTWWVGDSIGVLIATPLMFILFAHPRELWRSRLTSVGLPLLASCAIMVVLFVRSSAAEQDNLRLRFHEQAKLIATTFQFRFELYSKALQSIERFIVASEQVNRVSFAKFTANLPDNFPGIRGLSWNALVTAEQRNRYEADMAAQGYSNFQITERDDTGQLVRAQPRPSYVVITYIEPYSENLAAPGFDVASNPLRKAALEQARITGKTAITAPINLVQDQHEQPAVLMFQPLYRAQAIEQSPDLLGYTVAVIQMNRLIENAISAYHAGEFQLELVDITDGTPALLYSNVKTGLPAYAETLTWQGETQIGSRTLLLRVLPTEAFLQANKSLQPWTMLAGGLLLCSLLGGFLLTMTGRADQTKHLIARRTLELRAVLKHAADAILTVSENGRIERANPAACQLFGYSDTQLTQLSLTQLVPALNNKAVSSLQTQQGSSVEVSALHQSSQKLELELSLSSYELDERTLYTCMLRDIGPRKQIERLKSEFVATVSHELRTPLTSIKGSLGLLSAGVVGELPPKVHELVQIANTNVERLVSLVNDILDIEKLEFGQARMHLEPTKLRPLLEESLQSNQGYADNFKVGLALDLQALPEQTLVAVDSHRIQQVLANLISNAVKFSPTGDQVTVSADVVGNNVKVTISDHGPGISEEFHSRIFQKFAQADGSDRRRQGGTGLGLSICQTLMERMNGEIGFTSESGKGSQFYFTLPLISDKPINTPSASS